MIKDLWHLYIKGSIPYIFLTILLITALGVSIKKGFTNHRERKHVCVMECEDKRNLKYVDYLENNNSYLVCICNKKDDNLLTFQSIIINNIER